MDFMWSKMSIPLPFHVQSKFKFEFVFNHDNKFHTLMIHLTEPDRKYGGGMQHKMIWLLDLVGSVVSNSGEVVVGK